MENQIASFSGQCLLHSSHREGGGKWGCFDPVSSAMSDNFHLHNFIKEIFKYLACSYFPNNNYTFASSLYLYSLPTFVNS